MPEPLELSALVVGALDDLRQSLPDEWIEGTVRDVAVRLRNTNELVARLKEATAMMELDLAERMEADQVPVAGVGLLRRQRAYRERWRGEDSSREMRRDLAEAAAATVALDLATGEVITERRNVALAAIYAAFEAVPSFTNLLVAGRRKFHLSIDDYRERDPYFKVTIEEGL